MSQDRFAVLFGLSAVTRSAAVEMGKSLQPKLFSRDGATTQRKSNANTKAMCCMNENEIADVIMDAAADDGARSPKEAVIPIPNQGATFVGSSSAPQRTVCTSSSPQSSPPWFHP